MNAFAIAIVTVLVLEFSLDVAENLLNLRALRLEIPPALQGVYRPDKYRRSQEYLRSRTRFSLVSTAFMLALLLAFWFSHGFNFLNELVLGWGLVPLATGLAYIFILAFAYFLIGLPFTIYGTFVIEERFGFNRTTPRLFLVDQLKGLVLGGVLGGLLLASILALFEYLGLGAWVYGWAAVAVMSLVMQYIAPRWIMPMFNKFTPMEPGELKDAILKYARSVDFPIENIFVMDGSRRSSRSNAFFTGFGRSKRITLFDTLIAQHTVGELVAVLAHEVGHYKKRHILQGTIIGILHTGLLFFLLSLFLGSPGLYQAFYVADQPVYAGLIFFGLLYIPIEQVISIVMTAVSRRNEYEADRFAAETVDDPADLVSALKKLSAANLSNLTPHPFYVFLNYSHPPLAQRVEAIENAGRARSRRSGKA